MVPTLMRRARGRSEVFDPMDPSIYWRGGFLLALLLTPLIASPSVHAAETYAHDAMGRLIDVAYANGGSLHYTYDANGNLLSIVASLATAVEEGGTVPEFALGPTLPNPASGSRSIVFTTPVRGHVTLRVFDVSGREVATLYDRVLDSGRYVARFSSDRWAGGVYFYRLEMGGRMRVGRMVVLR
jgi:YD repeat-containing protein